MMRLTVDGMMTARLRPHRQHRLAQRENSATGAWTCPTARVPAWSASSAGSRGRPSPATSPSTISCPASSTATRSASTSARMLETSGKSFDEIWRARAAANPAKRYGRPARARRLLRVSVLGACRFHHRPELAGRRRQLSGDILNDARKDHSMKLIVSSALVVALIGLSTAPVRAQNLPVAHGHRRRALPGRWLGRRRRAHPGAEAQRDGGPALHRRESSRRRVRNRRRQRRRQVRARRLHADAVGLGPRHQSVPLQERPL